MATRVLTWRADEESGEQRMEQVRVDTGPDRLRARGTILVGAGELVGSDGPYRVDYELDTVEGWAHHRLVVRVEGAGWRRELWLRRDAEGGWSCRRLAEPDDHRPGIEDSGLLAGALDCDLLSSPLFNTMPVARSGLHRGAARQDFLMAWVSIPDLTVTPSRQTYEHVRPGVVSFTSEGGATPEIELDDDGFVLRYPAVASRV
jgi:hypothetical protein